MREGVRRLPLEVRRYRDEDEAEVLDLLGAALGAGPAGERSVEFFRWKHWANPFGPSFMLVAEIEGRIAGLRAFMRWRFRAGDEMVRAVRAVDTATHPDYQGMGVFSRLTREAVETLRGEIDLVFNTPNEKSLPGYLKLGWRIVGTIPVSVRVRHPIRFARGLRSLGGTVDVRRWRLPVGAESATEALRDVEGVTSLLEADHVRDPRLTTPRDLEFLRWRYASAPLLDYRAVKEEREGRLRGLAIFRVRPRGRLWESTVAEVFVAPGEDRTARQLLRRVAAAARVDHLTCHFPVGSAAARAARRSGFFGSPQGITLVVNPLGREIQPDPTSIRSWALSLGDAEVF